MILEIRKQRVIMITMRIVRVLDVKKVVYELPGTFAGAPQSDNDSSKPPENCHKKFFLLKVLIQMCYIVMENYLKHLS